VKNIRGKYGLTSIKAKGAPLVLLAVNEVLDITAEIAGQEHAPVAASRIRRLKWSDNPILPASLVEIARLSEPA
jgi:hypothetical protein